MSFSGEDEGEASLEAFLDSRKALKYFYLFEAIS
jgi:hypothetical protein